MKTLARYLSMAMLVAAPGIISAATVCPSTPNTNSDCAFLITISNTGSASVSAVAGAAAFNGPQTFTDGTMDPGNNGSLVGVVNDSSMSLKSFDLTGSGSAAGIFDFSFNGICVYTNAGYCATSQTGYEGPTTTFSNLKSGVLFQTTMGTVSFGPALSAGSSTYFSIEDNPADISAHGGLMVSNLAFGSTSATPEPADFALLGLGFAGLLLLRRKLSAR